jgi:hypothetical protein
MSITQKLLRLAVILDELALIDLGYPPSENTISPPRAEAVAILTEAGLSGIDGLSDLYSACDGISMPDVHTGYFIKSLRRVLEYDPSSEPLTILLEDVIPILPFGSTGGGSLFVVERQGGRVLYLPPGPLHEGRYDGRQTNVRPVAENISRFLDLLIDDAEAFVRDERGHRYLADRS